MVNTAKRHAQNHQKHLNTEPQTKLLGGLASSVTEIDLTMSVKLEAQRSTLYIWTKENTQQAFVFFSGLRSKPTELELVLQNYEFHIITFKKPNFMETIKVPLKFKGTPQ